MAKALSYAERGRMKFRRLVLSRFPACWRRILYRGGRFYCPICRSGLRRFWPVDEVHRQELCPVCFSYCRDRLAWFFLRHETNLWDGRVKRVLHVAPERSLEPRLREISGVEYLSADLRKGRAMVQMDLTQIEYEDNWFDAIYCSHVLEHIVQDRQAMRELYRVLRPGGWAMILVPVPSERTVEEDSPTSAADRLRLFGQADHVRSYGPDIAERLTEAGFRVRTVYPSEIAREQEVERMNIVNDPLFFCRKENV